MALAFSCYNCQQTDRVTSLNPLPIVKLWRIMYGNILSQNDSENIMTEEKYNGNILSQSRQFKYCLHKHIGMSSSVCSHLKRGTSMKRYACLSIQSHSQIHFPSFGSHVKMLNNINENLFKIYSPNIQQYHT